MSDDEGVVHMVTAQWVTILLLGLILWRVW